MSVGRSVSKIAAEVNKGLKIYKFLGGFGRSHIGPVLDTQKIKDIPQLNQQLTFLSVSKDHAEKLYCISPKLDVTIRKSIIEPERNIKINFELPVKKSPVTELDLPLHIEKEVNDPGKVISKKAIKMIRIRRKKMRKHKMKKYAKKYASEIFQRRLKRKMEKEENFKASIRGILNAGSEFSAEKYVDDLLEKVHWKRPVTHVRGRLAPQWVIKEHLQNEKEKISLKKRLEECSE